MIKPAIHFLGRGSVRQLLPLFAGILIGVGSFAFDVAGPFASWIAQAVAVEVNADPPEGAGDDEQPSEQPTKELPVNDNLKRQTIKIGGILKAGSFGPGERAICDEYYRDYALPRWTSLKTLGGLGGFHKKLRDELGAAKGEVHDHLNRLVLDFMTTLVNGPYDVRAQLNAALMIGELNSVEPTSGTEAKPLRDALPVLISMLENESLSDAVRVAVMVGIVRHAAAGIDDDTPRNSLTAALLKQATVEIPATAAGPGRDWIRGQVVDALGYLGSVGENGEVYNAIVGTLADSDISLSTRCLAAQSLGRLKYANSDPINVVEAAAKLGRFIVDACNDESQQVKESDKPSFRRRLVVQCLSAVSVALTGNGGTSKGISALAHDGQEASLDALKEILDEKTKSLEEKTITEEVLNAQIEDLRLKVGDWLKGQSG